MNGAKISVLEQPDHVSFTGLLNREDCLRLESQVTLVLCGDLSHKSLEGQLADEKFGGFLKLSNLTKSHGTWSKSVGLLYTFVSHVCSFASRLLRQLLSGSFGAGVLAGGLLGAGHFNYLKVF